MKSRPELTFRQGRRVGLRILCEDDLPLLTTWMNDPEVTQFILAYQPKTLEQEREWLQKITQGSDTDYVFGIECIETDTLIGVMGLHKVNHVHGTAVTGAFIGDKNYWSKGYGSEAKMLLLNYAFNTLSLRKICGAVIAFNERCLAYQKKCGYVVEGVLKEHVFKNGTYWDEVLVAVWREQWEPIWKRYQDTGKV